MALRALPCDACQEPLLVAGKAAAALKTGEPYVIGRAPTKFPFRVYCAKCKRVTHVTAAEFNALPRLKTKHLEEHGLLAPMLKDLRGAGFNEGEARDLFDAGWSPRDLATLPAQVPA